MLNRFVFSVLSSLLFIILFVIPISGSEWSYRSQGNWIISTGDHQSPIDIVTKDVSISKTLGPIVLHYKDIIKSVDDTGHAVQASLSGTASIDNRTFRIVQVHFHSPSEHTVNGKQYPMEAHFVHLADDGRLAVIAILFNIGAENPFFSTVMANFQQNNKKNVINMSAPVLSVFPKNLSYYHYLGSLTTPPLSENVEWYILTTPQTISASQLDQLKHFYNNNVHVTQPLAGRPVLLKTVSTQVNY